MNTAPLIPEVYVLWHPKCALGEPLARAIYQWLRPGNGLGPQVYFRSLPAPEAPADGLPLPLPGGPGGRRPAASGPGRVANWQVVLPLIDHRMIADPAWRRLLASLPETPAGAPRREVFPVALEATAYNVPGSLRTLNFLRPAGLPLPSGAQAIAAYQVRGPAPGQTAALSAREIQQADEVEVVVRSLQKQLTEALSRLFLTATASGGRTSSPGRSAAAPPKLTLFLSHAKADGTIPARRLRDYIYGQTQLAAFYDENDIAFGSVFASVLEQDLGAATTAALVAVRSARYAGRPWCRRELSLFRTPRPELPGPRAQARRWRLYPVLMVEAMEPGHASVSIPEFGNAPVIRWDAGCPHLEEQIINTVLRDALLASFHSALGAAIPSRPDRLVINWLPDPTTLLHLPGVRSGRRLELVHPGQGLSRAELDVLLEFFPRLSLRSFEEVLT